VLLGIPYTATNQNHTLSIRLEDEDGQRIPLRSSADQERRNEDQPAGQDQPGLNAQFNVGRPATIQPGDAQILPFAVNLDQLRFDAPGAYSFVIDIDDVEVKRLIFRVMLPVSMLRAAG